jgi:hypothetical protein
MNNYELYINKQPLDLETKFTFGLIYQSPVFTDIAKIAGNRTTTIKIPKTTGNLRTIENCQMPDNISEFPYKKQDAVELRKNGIPLIQNGTMILLSINDYIELAIIWGNKTNISTLQETKLRELPGKDYVHWSAASVITNLNKGNGFANSNFGQENNIRYKHPFISLNWIMDRILQKTGLEFSYPENIQSEKEKIYIPLIEKNINEETFYDTESGFGFTLEQYIFSEFTLEINLKPPYLGAVRNETEIYKINSNSITIKQDCDIRIKGDINFLFLLNNTNPAYVYFNINVNNENIIRLETENKNSSAFFSLEKEDISISVKEGDTINFALRITGVWPGVLKIFIGALEIHPESKTVLFGARYPIAPNLPDITCLDFVKTFMLLFGLFAYYDKDSTNKIRFFSVDEIYSRKSIAKDWTNKLVTGNRVENITFTFQDYAQKNHIRYLKDETVGTNANGYIEVDNQTLEKEKDIAELKFATSDEDRNKFIYIPLYTKKEKGEGEEVKVEIEYQKTTNRIALMDFGASGSTARFPSKMYFGKYGDHYGNNTNSPGLPPIIEIVPGRITGYYKKYQEILLRPKVIEATFLLNEPDLYNIDMLTPVYLEQTGQYYAIIDINVNEKGAKCKLLQM